MEAQSHTVTLENASGQAYDLHQAHIATYCTDAPRPGQTACLLTEQSVVQGGISGNT